MRLRLRPAALPEVISALLAGVFSTPVLRLALMERS